MAVRKLSITQDMFDELALIGVVTPLKDYRLAFYLNQALETDLAKYSDFTFENKKGGFSWYFYRENGIYKDIIMVSNSNGESKLITEQKIDYFLLLKNVLENNYTSQLLKKIRSINGISMAFELPPEKIKNAAVLIESLELHEMRETANQSLRK